MEFEARVRSFRIHLRSILQRFSDEIVEEASRALREELDRILGSRSGDEPFSHLSSGLVSRIRRHRGGYTVSPFWSCIFFS